uniref:Uncharacterized protein n=1 Tax=Ditylenchus dipsaci TaxID=166011 RepID=A0A915EBS1_9BILA
MVQLLTISAISVLVLCLEERVSAAILNRYHPLSSDNGEVLNYQRPFNLRLELLASSGASPKMKQVARQSIINSFTGQWGNSGYESDDIGTNMEKYFAGAWMVGIFDIDYDAAYTIIRRSPSYMLYGANDRAILIAREGNGSGKPNERPII